ncbi:MAG: hypothetical protein GWN46_05400, partial [Gammaproteobacteria bacterium]|nr:hypothetical protein [Gammaproteobacteria bacterium]
GTFRDIAHPLNNETRRRIEEQIIDRYKDVVAEGGGAAAAPLRELGQNPAGDTSHAMAAMAVNRGTAESTDSVDTFETRAPAPESVESFGSTSGAIPRSDEDEETDEGSWP